MPICLHLPLLTVLLWYLPKGVFLLCTPQIIRFLNYFPCWKSGICTPRSFRRSTLSTNLVPICLHQPYDCSPLVSSKYIVCNIAKAIPFYRNNLMVKDIRYISYGCMFVATSLSSPTFTADCT